MGGVPSSAIKKAPKAKPQGPKVYLMLIIELIAAGSGQEARRAVARTWRKKNRLCKGMMESLEAISRMARSCPKGMARAKGGPLGNGPSNADAENL
jgi:hypothetical protein